MYLFLLCFFIRCLSCNIINHVILEMIMLLRLVTFMVIYMSSAKACTVGGGSTARCCNLSFSDLSLADLSPVVNSRIVKKIIIIFKKERLKDASLMVRKADRNIEII